MVFFLSWLIFRKVNKAALISFIIILFSLMYGHAYQSLKGVVILGLSIGQHRMLIPEFLIAAAVLVFLAARSSKKLHFATLFLNLMVIFLTAMALIQIGVYWLSRDKAPTAAPDDALQTLTSDANSRDVYYIVLDSYGRQDWLMDAYGYDNSDFVNQLTAMGFYFPDCTQSNYVNTYQSIFSALNMAYLEDFGLQMQPSEQENVRAIYPFLQQSQARQIFGGMGYQFITFKSVYPFLDIPDADIYYDVEATTAYLERAESLNFRYLWLDTTILTVPIQWSEYSPDSVSRLPAWLVKLINPAAGVFKSRYVRQYQQNLYALDRLDHIAEVPGRKFVYAHLYTTHQPFVFTPDGSMVWPIDENADLYVDQVKYANSRILNIVKTILDQSETPPIIILQGDHNYSWDESRVKILNAYYLPDGGVQALYPDITPVNTFRVVLNQYFNASYPLLPDQSYFTPRDQPEVLREVPSSCSGN